MSCVTKNCCLAGAGTIFLKEYNPCCDETNDAPFLSIGNASTFTINAELTELRVEDYQSIAGGSECTTSWINNATASLTGFCLNAANFARAWTGQIDTLAANTVLVSGVASAVDSFVPFVDPTGDPVTNVDVSGVTIPELGVKGIDYVVKQNGVYIPSTSTLTFASPVSFSVLVPFSEYSQVQMLTDTSKEYVLFYDGVNRFGGNPFSVTLYRVKLKPVSGIPLLGVEAATAEFEFEILKDECRTSAKPIFSQYGTLAI